MTELRPAGPILDDLGVHMALDPNDRVTEVLVIGKLTNLETGDVGLVCASNDLDWIARWGLLAAAGEVERGVPPQPRDEQ
jgi:hypothetical protein